jgi:phosphotransferase family enzyme
MTRLSAAKLPTGEHGRPSKSLADEGYARRLLSACVPEIASGDWHVLSCQVTDIRGGRRKPVALYALTYRNGTEASTRTDQVVAKVYRAKKDRAGSAHEALRTLWEAGFRPPARFRVPRPYGYSARRSASVQEEVRGTPWADFLHAEPGSLARASSRSAAWLSRLQRSGVVARPYEVGEEVGEAERYVRELTRRYPALGPRLKALLERLGPRLEAEELPLVPSHGDFHPKNILLTDGLTTVIDFDSFGMREAAHDVGYVMGQILIMSHFRLKDVAPGAEAAIAFWERYQKDGPAPWSRVAVHMSRTYLRILHYVLCALDTERPELLELWPPLMEYWLESDGSDAIEDLIRSR